MTRRDLSFLIPALAAARVSAQDKPAPDKPAQENTAQDHSARMPTKLYHDKEIPYTGDDSKKGRRFFYGATHTDYKLEMHETILGAGTQTHAPHKHEHEEIVIVMQGAIEMYNDGKTDVAETGSVIYFGSNQMHSVRNVGSTPCRYYVLELRANEA
jgi:quercetin dioxygenase-like cupin family protein